jgi:signal transduction histidine kinase
VRLSYGSNAIRLEVRDDGRGFETAMGHLAAAGHFGILGMRERMEQIGGSLEVCSRPGGGTLITAQLAQKPVAASC